MQQEYTEDQYIEQEYNDYDYVDDEYFGSDTLVRTQSTKNNQYELKDLHDRIIQEVRVISELTNWSMDWAFALYYACGWQGQLVRQLILSEQQSHIKLVHYIKEQESQTNPQRQMGPCMVCGQQNTTLYRSMCGHEFCLQCWKEHLMSRLQDSFKEPFPPCIMGQSDCPIRMSYSFCSLITEGDQNLANKFREVLCRSYSTMSKQVKVCKGREGFSCSKCFTIDKMFDVIECETCGNFVCPRCGERSHGNTNCFDIRNWKEITENSIDFVEFLNFRFCPNCKEAVERSSGCNHMVCKCKQQFCYVCGQKWIPKHSTHSDQSCPKYKQIQTLNEQRKKRKENQSLYFEKVHERKEILDTIDQKIKRVQEFKKQLPEIISFFMTKFKFYESQLNCLSEFCRFLQKSFCFLWGQILSFYFVQGSDEKQSEFLCAMMSTNLDKIYEFLFQFTQKYYRLFKTQECNLNTRDKKNIREIIDIFVQEFVKHSKEVQNLIQNVSKQIEDLTSRYALL